MMQTWPAVSGEEAVTPSAVSLQRGQDASAHSFLSTSTPAVALPIPSSQVLCRVI